LRLNNINTGNNIKAIPVIIQYSMNFLNTGIVPFLNVVNGFRNNTGHRQIMVLNMYVDGDNCVLKNMYLNAANKHNLSLIQDPHFFNAGFDLFLPEDQTFTSECANKSSSNVKCSAKVFHINDILTSYFTGYYMYPRSSLSKTPLRLANSVGIIDAGYRGPLIGMFDCLTNAEYKVDEFTRLLQICAPNLMPIFVRVVDSVEELSVETSRGEGGFGSTG
jgi:dUTP pyrophosphatase